MKILFVLKNENFMAPLGLCFISGVAKKNGHQVYLSEMNSEDTLRRVRELRPDIVAYSSSSGEAKHYLKLNEAVKEAFPHIFTIMGGPHPTFFPEMIRNSTLDAVCIGEGEDAFVELLEKLSSGRASDPVKNIYTRASKDIQLRDLEEDLDSIGHPDYGIVYDTTPLGRYPLKSFMTSRGCPYHCTYCFNHAWNALYLNKGKIVRRHSVEFVLDDIQGVQSRWPLSSIKFYDDIFAYKVDEWLERFSKEYKRRISLPFFILTRADLLNEDMIKLLKAAGCHTISMSIEAGNPDVRRDLLKRTMTNDQLIKAHELCRRYGIYTFTNIILGLPHTSLQNDIESIELAIQCKVDWAEFAIFHPYPKTELGERCREEGIHEPDYNKMHSSCQSFSPLSSFTQKEKNAQRNLATLGVVAVTMPWMRRFIYRYLIRVKHNIFYTFIYYAVKMRIMRSKIYVTRTSFLNSMRIMLKSLKQELYRHEKSDEVEVKR